MPKSAPQEKVAPAAGTPGSVPQGNGTLRPRTPREGNKGAGAINPTGICVLLPDQTAPRSPPTGKGAGIRLAETWALASDALDSARKVNVETKGDWN